MKIKENFDYQFRFRLIQIVYFAFLFYFNLIPVGCYFFQGLKLHLEKTFLLTQKTISELVKNHCGILEKFFKK